MLSPWALPPALPPPFLFQFVISSNGVFSKFEITHWPLPFVFSLMFKELFSFFPSIQCKKRQKANRAIFKIGHCFMAYSLIYQKYISVYKKIYMTNIDKPHLQQLA